MVIYLEGAHGIRIAYSEDEAQSHEKDGYKRIDYNERWGKKPVVKKVRKPKKLNPKKVK